MANSYNQVFVHCVWAVKYRLGMITQEVQNPLYQYITGIIRNEGHQLLAIGGISDHIHLLFSQSPKQSLSDIMRIAKCNSSLWLNEKGVYKIKFHWQDGYGAFSVSKDRVPQVKNYILNQANHHNHIPFLDEFRSILINQGIDFDEAYIFREPE